MPRRVSEALIAAWSLPDAAALAALMSCEGKRGRGRMRTHDVDRVLNAGTERGEGGLRRLLVRAADVGAGVEGGAELRGVLERRLGLRLVAAADGGVEVGEDLSESVPTGERRRTGPGSEAKS